MLISREWLPGSIRAALYVPKRYTTYPQAISVININRGYYFVSYNYFLINDNKNLIYLQINLITAGRRDAVATLAVFLSTKECELISLSKPKNK